MYVGTRYARLNKEGRRDPPRARSNEPPHTTRPNGCTKSQPCRERGKLLHIPHLVYKCIGALYIQNSIARRRRFSRLVSGLLPLPSPFPSEFEHNWRSALDPLSLSNSASELFSDYNTRNNLALLNHCTVYTRNIFCALLYSTLLQRPRLDIYRRYYTYAIS